MSGDIPQWAIDHLDKVLRLSATYRDWDLCNIVTCMDQDVELGGFFVWNSMFPFWTIAEGAD